jgi:uncharacterized protein (TIGR02246 family)
LTLAASATAQLSGSHLTRRLEMTAADTPGPSDHVSAVRSRSEAVVAAESAFDVEAVMTFWAEDAILQPAGGPQLQGRPAISHLYRQYFESGMLKEFSASATHIEASSSGDLAFESGVSRMVLTGDEGDLLDKGKYLLVWKKIDGEWMIAALGFTSDAPAPTAIEG